MATPLPSAMSMSRMTLPATKSDRMEAPAEGPCAQLKFGYLGRREESVSGDYLDSALLGVEIQISLLFQSTRSHLWLVGQKVIL